MVGRPQNHLAMLDTPIRQLCAFAVLVLFVVFFFSDGLSYHYDYIAFGVTELETKFPDFGNYQDIRTLSAEQFPLDDPARRVIIVGDVHGMHKSLQKILNKISYNPSSDVLVHVGDVLTKGAHVGSMETLSFMASHNITGVRGNHDQQVIEWHAWILWIRSQPGGSRWLEEISTKWTEAEAEGTQLEDWIEGQKRKDSDEKWWKLIPKGWTLFGAHFAVAQDMSAAHFTYLRNLPTIIHIPSAHAFIVHGGILPSNPELKHNHPSQPLARVPRLPKGSNKNKNKLNTTTAMRTLQERAILTQVPQNTVPYNLLNIRSIVDDKVTKSSKGKPWSKIWKHDMLRCAGFDGELIDGLVMRPKKELLPCYPSTVIYGHAAGRGLDVKRWSIGLDSGCVYERRMSALVLGGDNSRLIPMDDDDMNTIDEELVDTNEDEDNDDIKGTNVKFGESHLAKIVSVKCP